jgi:hypothetical protein
MVKRCEACQFHAKQIHQPVQELKTIPLTWPFAVWGLDILGPFPRVQGATATSTSPSTSLPSGWRWNRCAQSRPGLRSSSFVGWSVALVCLTASSPTMAASSPADCSGHTVHRPASRSFSPQSPTPGAMVKPSAPTPKSSKDSRREASTPSLKPAAKNG